MLIYKKDWVDNLDIKKKVAAWLTQNFITRDENSKIGSQYYSGYHESSLWSRIGMFVFTIILVIAASTMFSMVLMRDISRTISFASMFFGACYYAAAEFFTREKNYFRSGVTDALLYSGVLCFGLGVVFLLSGKDFDFSLDPVVYLIGVLPVLIFPSLRFADAFLASCAFVCLFVINAMLIMKMGSFGKAALPFEGMGLSFLFYYMSKQLLSNESYRFWKRPIIILEIASLVTLYVSGNYLVVRQLTEEMLHITIPQGGEIQLPVFFYCYTILIPLLYLWRGLNKKDYILIRLGLLLEVAGILSIRFYHSFLPPETAMLLGGTVLVVTSWLGINYLKTPKHGLTSMQMDTQHDDAITAISSVLISQTGKDLQNALDGKGDIFKGGSSGGGGAGESF